MIGGGQRQNSYLYLHVTGPGERKTSLLTSSALQLPTRLSFRTRSQSLSHQGLLFVFTVCARLTQPHLLLSPHCPLPAFHHPTFPAGLPSSQMPHSIPVPATGFQALILCGPGVSLNTFTSNPEEYPKCLIPVANRPMVYYPLDFCKRSGITGE